MIAKWLLLLVSLPTRNGSSIILKGTELDEVKIPGEVFAIPHKAINTVANQWYGQNVIGIFTCLRFVGALNF
jgi:hypothetical protein